MRNFAEMDRLQAEYFAEEIEEAVREGKVIAVCTAWHPDKGTGYAVAIHAGENGEKQRVFFHKNQIITTGVPHVGGFFKCRLHHSANYDRPSASEIELFTE